MEDHDDADSVRATLIDHVLDSCLSLQSLYERASPYALRQLSDLDRVLFRLSIGSTTVLIALFIDVESLIAVRIELRVLCH